MDDEPKQFTLDLSQDSPQISPREPKPKKPGANSWFMLVYAGQIGVSIIIPLLVGIFAGRYFDQQYQTHPKWLLIGLGAGLLLSVLSLITMVREIIKKVNAQ